jgi:hypothetical protein
VFNEAEVIVNGYWEDVLSLQENTVSAAAADSTNVSLTVQREMVDFKLEFAQFQTEMLEVYLDEVKEANEKDLAKDMILRVCVI